MLICIVLFLRTMRKLRNDELDRLNVEEFKKHKKIPLAIVLDNVRSMHNVGSIFRSSDAFLVEKIFLCGITAKPPHKDIHKTALGSTESVAWEFFEETKQVINELKNKGYTLMAIEQAENSIMLQDFKPVKDQYYAVVFGHEVRGVRQEIVDECDYVIEVPQFGTKHSLNISVCAGIVIWDFYNKLNCLK